MQKHEDDRRIIYDWANGDFKSVKAVVIKSRIPVGDHYHLNKDERFFLLQGEFEELTVGSVTDLNVLAPYLVNIPRGTYHRFVCSPGSILLGVSTELHDEKDDHK